MPGWVRRYGKEGLFVLVLLVGVHLFKTRKHPTGPAPVVPVQLLDGTRVELGAAGAEPLMLHFWATWCGVCSLEESTIESLSRDGHVLTVATHSGSAADLRRHMQARGLTFPVVNDPDGSLARKYGVHEFPSTFFLSRSGAITTSEVGYTTGLGLRLRRWIAGW